MDSPVDPAMWGGEDRKSGENRETEAGPLPAYRGLLTVRNILTYLMDEVPRLGLQDCVPLLEAVDIAVEDALVELGGDASRG